MLRGCERQRVRAIRARGALLHPKIASWLGWEPTGLGPYETIRARLMSRVLVLTAVLVGLQVPLQLLLPGNPGVALIPAAVVLEHAAALALLWSGRQQAAALLVLGAGMVLFCVILVPLGGLHGTAVVYVGFAGLLAVTWLEPRPAAVVVGVCVAMLVGVFWIGPPPERIRVFAPGDELRLALVFSYALAVVLTFALVQSTTHALHTTSVQARQRADDAARAAETALRASEAKSRFLATMSHELRTPLNAILGYAGLLHEDGGPNGEELARIEAAGRQLLGLVDDVLEMVRADQAPRPVRPEPVELRALVDGLVAPMTTARITVVGADTLTVETDAEHVERILGILLANAVRYTRGGQVEVALFRDASEVRVAVRDAGRGIPKSFLPLLFEPFVQARASARADRPELGTALSQRLARHLGGRIEVVSLQGKGTTFTLHLPTGVR